MKSSSDQELIGKLIILGDSSVGKTSMFMKYFDNKFDERTNPTLGVDYKIRTVPLGGGQQMKMMIWDTSGQERYHSISDSFYRNSDGIFIVFSLLDRESFEHISKWLDRVYNQAPKDVIIMLIGRASLTQATSATSTPPAKSTTKQSAPRPRVWGSLTSKLPPRTAPTSTKPSSKWPRAWPSAARLTPTPPKADAGC